MGESIWDIPVGKGVDIIDRGKRGECPIGKIKHPDATNPDVHISLRPTPEQIAAAAKVTVEREENGRRLWGVFHSWPATADLDRVDEWMKEFNAMIECWTCWAKWVVWINLNPPLKTSRDDLFAWTVKGHNAVNAGLDKPEMTLADARKQWGYAPARAGG